MIADPEWVSDAPGIIFDAIDGNVAMPMRGCAEEADCAPNPCDPDPEMLLTVTGTTGTILWAGETWNLPADSGVEKSVCPDTFQCLNFTSIRTTNILWYSAICTWAKSTGTTVINNELELRKVYQNGAPTTLSFWVGNANRTLRVHGDDDVKLFNFSGLGTRKAWTMTNSSILASTIKKITALAQPTWTAFHLEDEYFGSHTIAGVTYTWAKGKGWP